MQVVELTSLGVTTAAGCAAQVCCGVHRCSLALGHFSVWGLECWDSPGPHSLAELIPHPGCTL